MKKIHIILPSMNNDKTILISGRKYINNIVDDKIKNSKVILKMFEL